MSRVRLSSFVALIVSSAALAGCGASNEEAGSEVPGVTKEEIVLGTTSPLTGGVASACKPLTDGAASWFKKVNEEGGIHGRQIKNIVLDDVYTAPKALSNSRELADEPVFAFFGGCGTIQPPAIVSVADPKGIPYLFPYTDLSSEIDKPTVFTMLPSYPEQLSQLIPWTLDKYGSGSIFLLNVKIPGAEASEQAVKDAADAAGAEFLGSETTTPGQADLTPLILKLKQLRPDYVVLGQTSQDAARLVKTMAAQDAFPAKKIIGFSTLATKAFVNPAGELADGRVITASPVAPWGSAEAESCESAFAEASTPVEPDGASLYGCAMAQLMTRALEDAGSEPTRESLIESIESFDDEQISDILPPATFSKDDHSGASSMWVAAVNEGQLIPEGMLDLK